MSLRPPLGWLGLLALMAAVLALTGCDAEDLLQERLRSAQTLSPGAISALLIGGSFFSEDLTCVSAGVMVSRGAIPFWLAALVCTIGVWVSDSVLYGLGVLGRHGLLDRAPLRWIVKRSQLEQGSGLFDRHGAKMIILSRFLPGSRLPLYVSAGLLRYSYAKFAGWMAVAAVLWAPVMVWLSLKLGNALLGWLEAYEKAAWVAVPTVVLVIWLFMKGLEWIVGRKGRAILHEPE
jgi:membrane protein DedA with SNARE-associated domain